MKFIAKEVFADYDENDVLVIGFVGPDIEGVQQNYFMIQDAKNEHVQSLKLGLDKYYVELNDQSTSCYGGVRKLKLRKNRIYIEFDKTGRARFKELSIEIGFKCNVEEFDNLQNRLNQIFHSTAVIFE